jgi:hypothetical protein
MTSLRCFFIWTGPTPELHWEELRRSFSFFERVKTLPEAGVLDVKVLDGMFGHQFFWLVNDAWVQERLLPEAEHFFRRTWLLPSVLPVHRRRSGYEFPCDRGVILIFKVQGGYDKNLRRYREKHFNRKTAYIWQASPMVRMDTGWKPMLLSAFARRDASG